MKKNLMRMILLVILITGMVLTGCSSKSSEPEKDPVKETETSADSQQTVVSIQTWNPADRGPDSPIYQIISDFEEKNPDIKIDYVYVDSGSHMEQLKVKLMGGEGPDIFGISAGTNYNEFRDFEEDITSYCKNTWGDDWEFKFYDICKKSLESDGKYYGVPLGITYAGFAWADKAMLANYSLDVPTSYDDLLQVSKVLRENNQFPLAIGAKDAWVDIDAWMSIANDVNRDKLYSAIEGNTPFTDADLVESFRIWQNCFKDGIFQDGAIGMTLYNEVNDMFQKEGSIPMFINGSWALNMFTLTDEDTQKVFHSEGADHGIFLIDWNNDGKVCPLTASTDVILCMNKDSKVKDAAFQFMDYMVNEGQDLLVNKYLEYMPSRKDMELKIEGLSENGQDALKVVLENASDNVAGTRSISYAELSAKITDELQALAAEQLTPEEAAEQIEAFSKTIKRQ